MPISLTEGNKHFVNCTIASSYSFSREEMFILVSLIHLKNIGEVTYVPSVIMQIGLMQVFQA